MTTQFANEEIKSSYEYPKDYKANPTPKENFQDLEKELVILKSLFPELNRDFVFRFRNNEIALPLPEGAERWTLIPKWQKLASTYGESVERVVTTIGSRRKFHNYRQGQLGAKYLRQHKHSVAMFQSLTESQYDANILVVPAQFGLRHRGRSVRRAREVFTASEFGLGAFAAGIMLLTHPERLQHCNDLWIDCAGDEYSSGAGGRFVDAPSFYFGDGRLEFYAFWCGRAGEGSGSASGLFPQP